MSDWRILSVQCLGPEPCAGPDFDGPTLLIFPADADCEALAGAIAARTGAILLGRIDGAERDGDDLIVTRSTHGGHLTLTLRLAPSQAPTLAIATAHDAAMGEATITLGQTSTLPIARTPLIDQQAHLESANIVIGGGRGLDEAGFADLSRIAAALGGAVAASLPAVDLGLAPVSRQVGQSGKFVAPSIYFAAGMSGTPQHFAGVSTASRVIAVNKDPDAAIFNFAEAGAVADARQLLPMLADALEMKKANEMAPAPID